MTQPFDYTSTSSILHSTVFHSNSPSHTQPINPYTSLQQHHKPYLQHEEKTQYYEFNRHPHLPSSDFSPSSLLHIKDTTAFPALSLSQRYTDLSTLERSIFGCVKLATDTLYHQRVAIKISVRHWSEQGTAHTGSLCVERVERECAVMKHLNMIQQQQSTSSIHHIFEPLTINTLNYHTSPDSLVRSVYSAASSTDTEDSQFDLDESVYRSQGCSSASSKITSPLLHCKQMSYTQLTQQQMPPKQDSSQSHHSLYTSTHSTVSKLPLTAKAQIEHPGRHHIVELVEELQDDYFHYVITEFVPHGDLFSLLIAQPQQKLNECVCRKIFKQLVEAVDYMHQHHTVHLDLSLENAVVEINEQTGDVHCKLIDFGLATIHPTFNTTGLPGTVQLDRGVCQMDDEFICEPISSHALKPGKQGYMSYELSSGRRFDAKKNDIFSLGCCLYTLLSGKPPFRQTSYSDTWFSVLFSGSWLTPNIINQPSAAVYRCLSPEALDLINKIITPERHRLSLQQIKQHPWMLKQE